MKKKFQYHIYLIYESCLFQQLLTENVRMVLKTSEESDSNDSEIYLGVRLSVCQYTQTNVVEHRVNFEVEKWTSLQQK